MISPCLCQFHSVVRRTCWAYGHGPNGHTYENGDVDVASAMVYLRQWCISKSLLRHGANALTWHDHRQLRRPILSSPPLPHLGRPSVYDDDCYYLWKDGDPFLKMIHPMTIHLKMIRQMPVACDKCSILFMVSE